MHDTEKLNGGTTTAADKTVAPVPGIAADREASLGIASNRTLPTVEGTAAEEMKPSHTEVDQIPLGHVLAHLQRDHVLGFWMDRSIEKTLHQRFKLSKAEVNQRVLESALASLQEKQVLDMKFNSLVEETLQQLIKRFADELCKSDELCRLIDTQRASASSAAGNEFTENRPGLADTPQKCNTPEPSISNCSRCFAWRIEQCIRDQRWDLLWAMLGACKALQAFISPAEAGQLFRQIWQCEGVHSKEGKQAISNLAKLADIKSVLSMAVHHPTYLPRIVLALCYRMWNWVFQGSSPQTGNIGESFEQFTRRMKKGPLSGEKIIKPKPRPH